MFAHAHPQTQAFSAFFFGRGSRVNLGYNIEAKFAREPNQKKA